MRLIDRIGLAALHRLDPETAHDLALGALARGLVPLPRPRQRPSLVTEFAGLTLPNPLGLAAGFDKNARAIDALLRAGFGFIEVGAVTPRPQPGNPKPRLFRLSRDQAIINRFGFNNEGAEAVAERLAARPAEGIVGINLGANKDSQDRSADFAAVLTRCGAHVDFATVNVSSPNTENLRDLQGRDALAAVLDRTQEANQALDRPVPLLVKIAPDLDEPALDDIVEVAEAAGIAGIIATNTTLSRPALNSAHAGEAGGLSGAPLFDLSTRVLRQLRARTDLPLIGVGGISTAAQAREKLAAGATALQIYSALIYRGFGLVDEILDGLEHP